MKKLLISLILFLGYIGNAFAEPEWAQKPVQCADTQEVLDKIEADNMLPLVQMIGNTTVNAQTVKMVPYVMYYNIENETWRLVEFLRTEYACVIGLGQGVNFDVGTSLERETYQ
jgi:hypothetical protein